MPSTHHLIPLLAAGALAGGCGGSAAPRADVAPAAARQDAPPAGRIAFRRYFDDAQTRGAVFVINTEGTGEKQLTDPPPDTVDDNPDWSPDGRRIAFDRCGPKGCSVWIVSASGGAARKAGIHCRLKPVCDITTPSWHPNGSKLVVSVAQGRVREHGAMNQVQQSSLDLYDLRHDEQRTIIARRHFTGDTVQPALSPDGQTIVYKGWNSWLTNPVEGQALYAVGFDGTHNRRLTPWKLQAGDHPVWTPDSSTILFRSFEENENEQSDFWTVRPDRSSLAQLTHYKPGTLVRSASYSPDGKWIVHATNGVDGKADLFIMRADGTGSRPLTRTKLWDSAPDWGPPTPPAP
jgi:TolB protein